MSRAVAYDGTLLRSNLWAKLSSQALLLKRSRLLPLQKENFTSVRLWCMSIWCTVALVLSCRCHRRNFYVSLPDFWFRLLEEAKNLYTRLCRERGSPLHTLCTQVAGSVSDGKVTSASLLVLVTCSKYKLVCTWYAQCRIGGHYARNSKRTSK